MLNMLNKDQIVDALDSEEVSIHYELLDITARCNSSIFKHSDIYNVIARFHYRMLLNINYVQDLIHYPNLFKELFLNHINIIVDHLRLDHIKLCPNVNDTESTRIIRRIKQLIDAGANVNSIVLIINKEIPC